ncbi:MAG TPA: redoxin family protein [Candidatus Tumulicola sp.]|jgi:thiol-disulfide isomerase/thioredoxin
MPRLTRLVAACAVIAALGSGAALRAQPANGLASFAGASGWLNSPPLTPAQLRGKVVLVDFWEYTCINCLKTLPYLREWYKRYHDDGFTIVGVHSPEFHFSGETANVMAAAHRLGVTWPIALDDTITIWNRYHNQAWPGEYLFDQNGKLVETQLGEGNYQSTEAKIQALLKAANPQLKLPPVMALLPQDSYAKPGAVCYLQTPEILVGPDRSNAIANLPKFLDPTRDTSYADRTNPHVDGKVYLQGFWRFSPEGQGQGIVSAGGDGYLALRYHAIQVVAVMRPERGTRVVVTQDGKPVAREDAGADIRYAPDGASFITVDTPRAYDIIMNRHFGTHELRLSPGGIGLGIYDIAFESCEVGADK